MHKSSCLVIAMQLNMQVSDLCIVEGSKFLGAFSKYFGEMGEFSEKWKNRDENQKNRKLVYFDNFQN